MLFLIRSQQSDDFLFPISNINISLLSSLSRMLIAVSCLLSSISIFESSCEVITSFNENLSSLKRSSCSCCAILSLLSSFGISIAHLECLCLFQLMITAKLIFFFESYFSSLFPPLSISSYLDFLGLHNYQIFDESYFYILLFFVSCNF